jgi:hypothetical protein
MVFSPPSWVPQLPYGEESKCPMGKDDGSTESIADHCQNLDPPDTLPISQFMLDDAHGRCPIKKSRNPFTCGISGNTYTAVEMVDRVDYLSRALSKEFGWHPNIGTEWEKVIGIFALNTVRGLSCNIGRFAG